MRFESVELVGYVGIFNGMGLSQIKIDFNKCLTNKIIIRGSNGSGKTTIMSALHPYPEPNEYFIPGHEARKTIVIRDGHKLYVIKYIHPVQNNGQRATSKGFISRSIDGMNWEELNPGGMISVCRDIISEEFEFDPAFTSLAQLSSEDRGLVDKKPVERKRLINSIMSSLDVYNGIYKNINKRSAVLKNLITALTAKIDLIGDEGKLLAAITNLDKHIVSYEEERDMTIESIASVKLKQAELTNTLKESKYEEIQAEISKITKIITACESTINQALSNLKLDSISKLEEFVQYLLEEISSLEASIAVYSQRIPSLLSDREKESDRLQDKIQQLNGIRSEFNMQNVIQTLEECKSRIAEYDQVFSKMGLMNISLITRDEFNAAMGSLNRLLQGANAITHNYDLSYIREDVYERGKINSMLNALPIKRKELDRLLSEQARLDKELGIYLAKRELAKELSNRPKGCKIDDCVYIAEALKADKAYPEDGLKSLEQDLLTLRNMITEIEQFIARAEQAAYIRTDIGKLEHELESNIGFISKLPVRGDFKEQFLIRLANLDNFDDIVELYSFVDCGNILDDYKLLLENIKVYEIENKIYQSKSSIIEEIMKDIASLENKIKELSFEIDSVNNTLFSNKSKLEELTSMKLKIDGILAMYKDTLLPSNEALKDLEEKKAILDSFVQEYNTNQGILDKLNSNLGAVTNDLKNVTEQREALKHSLIMLHDYRTELGQFQKESSIIEKIKYYSSPSTGIQVTYINMYMNKLLSMANELLSLLFRGRFILQNFIINESEFRIPCMGESGILHDDISSMSSAEKAMISMILSFSLMHQSSLKYNILCLDEMDAALDDMNRFAFIDLLDNIMNMLNVEQCFLISHNSEIDTSMCDMILLRNDSNERYNCNMIWKY